MRHVLRMSFVFKMTFAEVAHRRDMNSLPSPTVNKPLANTENVPYNVRYKRTTKGDNVKTRNLFKLQVAGVSKGTIGVFKFLSWSKANMPARYYTSNEIARLTGLSARHVRRIMDRLSLEGVIEIDMQIRRQLPVRVYRAQ